MTTTEENTTEATTTPETTPFVPAMNADYYAKWDRLHKATQRAWSRLVRERSQAAIDAYTTAMGRLAEHEQAFNEQAETIIKAIENEREDA